MTTIIVFSFEKNLKHVRYTRTTVTTLTEKNNIVQEEIFY